MIKVVSAHQPAFLPWLGYLEKIALSDVFIIMDIAKFRKRSFMHRNKIEINNNPHIVGIHTEKNADFKNCDEIIINKNYKDDLVKLAEKINNNYKNEKFYTDLNDFCNNTLKHELSDKNLIELCLIQVEFLCKRLNISTKIIKESSIIKKDELKNLNASKRLLSHAKILKADVYITGVNSKDYLNRELFENEKIYNYIQTFDYNFFLNLQNSKEPLSIVHQIAKIGFDKIKDELAKNIKNKRIKIINHLK